MNQPPTKQQSPMWNNILSGLAAVAASASCSFAWQTHTDIVILKERDREKTEQISDLQQRANNMQLNIFDMKAQLSNIENQKPK